MTDRQGPVSCLPGKGGSLHSFSMAVYAGPTAEFEVRMPRWWSRRHTVTTALAIAVVLVWVLVVYMVFLE
jgi:hypothetical protein